MSQNSVSQAQTGHMRTAHNESKQFQCEHCDHMDNRSDNMKTHVKNNHSVFETR